MSYIPHEPLAPTQQTSRIARNVIILGGGQALSIAMSLILASVLGRTLGPFDFGTYYFIITVTTFAAVFVDWGQATVVVRAISQGRASEPTFLASAALIRTIIVFLAIPVTIGLTFLLDPPPIVRWLAPLALIFSLPAAYIQLLGHYLRGRDRMDLDTTSGLIAKGTAVMATVAALLLGGGVPAAVLMPVLGGLVGLMFALAMTQRLGMSLALPSPIATRELITAGAAVVVMSISVALHPLLDVMLLTYLTDAAVVGWHGAARSVIGMLISPALVLATASFPELCRAAGSHLEFRQVLAESSRLLFAAAGLGFCGTFVFSDHAISLIYGPIQFDPSATILKYCAPFFPLFFLNFVLGNAMLALNQSIALAIVKSIAVALSVVFSWYLIDIFDEIHQNGAVGVMVSFCATEVMMSFAYITILPRTVLSRTLFRHFRDAYIAGAAILILALQVVPIAPLWISGPFVLLAFSAAAMLTGLVRRDDFRITAALIAAVFSRRPSANA